MKAICKKSFALLLSLVLLLAGVPAPSLTAQAGSLSAYAEGYHHWPGVCLGGARLTAFGADAVTKESYTFSSDSYAGTREMNEADAPVAIYYTDINRVKTLTDLTNQKGFKMNIRVTDVRYCTVMQYRLAAGTSGYSTSVSSLRGISPSVGTNEDIYVYGPAPTAGGQTIDIPMTLWVYISQGGDHIDAGYKVKLRLIGYDFSALQALVDKEAVYARPASAYTAESFSVYSAALTAARSKLNEEAPLQTDIDAALSALQTAIAGLETSGELNVSDLYAALDEANALDQSRYMDFSGVTAAVNAGLSELAQIDSSTQERLDNRASAIRLAVCKLTPKSASAGLSAYTDGYHHWPGVCLGGARLTVFGADEVSKESADYTTNDYNQTREMNVSEAPVATFYTDVNQTQTLSDLANQKGFHFNIRVTDVRFCSVMQYRLSAGVSGYSTNVSSLRSISPSVGTNENLYVYGSAPAAGGQVIEIPVTLWVYISQGGQNIDAGYKIVLRLVGMDKSMLQTAISTEVLPQSRYTAESYGAYLTALSTAVAVNAKSAVDQSEINAAAETLSDAIAGLTPAGVLDISDLQAAIAEGRALNREQYLDCSGVDAAVAAANDALLDLSALSQEDVDNLASAIRLQIRKLAGKPAAAAGRSVKVEGTHHWPGVSMGGFRLSAYGADEVTADAAFSTDAEYMVREMNADLAPVATYYYDVNEIHSFAELASKKGFYLNYTVTNTSFVDIMNYYIATGNSAYTSSVPNQVYVGSGTSQNQTVNGTLPSQGGQELTLTLTSWTDIAQAATINNNTRYIHAGAKLKLHTVAFDKTALREAIAAEIAPESHYTPASYAAYLSALQTAVTVNDRSVVTQSEIDTAKNALLSAIDALTLKTFTVTFLRWDNEVIDRQTVSYGGSATPPETVAPTADTDSHVLFRAWSGSYTNVIADQTVTAVGDTAAHESWHVYSDLGDGTHMRACSVCGYSETNAHDYSVFVRDTASATCEANATALYACAYCAAESALEKPDTQLPHSYTGEVRSNEDGTHQKKCVNGCGAYGPAEMCDYETVVTAPTCIDPGYATHTCTVCGYAYTDDETAANGHSFTEYVSEVTPATCLANAAATYKCANCEVTAVMEVPDTLLPHSYTGDVKTNEDGTHSFRCVNGCGAFGTAVPCEYDDKVTAPTCTDGGYTTHTCTVCGYSYKDSETEATGHHFTEYAEEVSPATCLINATAIYQCRDCDETAVLEVPDSLLPHSYTGDVKTNGDGTHSFRCVNGCGAYGTAIPCEYDDKVTAPTCTDGGYTTHTCTVCGYSYKDSETEATGHHFTEYAEEVSPATCLINATAIYQCHDCDETAVLEVPDSLLPHSYTGDVKTNGDGTHSFRCVNGCGAYGTAVPCEYDDKVTAPTCTDGGYTTHTCTVCGYSYTDSETEATGHHFTEFAEIVSDGTCVNNRVELYRCRDCDATETREIGNSKDPENHVGKERTENRNVVNATCVTEGSYDIYTVCVSCGQNKGFVHVDGVTDPTNHVGGMETKIENRIAATCVSPETWEEAICCKGCGEELDRISRTGKPNPENHAGPMEVRSFLSATEEEAGYSGDTYCTACGNLVKTGEALHRTRGACAYCGGYHEGVWGSVVIAVHGILWLLTRFLNGSLFLP